ICALFLCIPFLIVDLLVDESIGDLQNIDKSNLVQQMITYKAVTTIALSIAFVTAISFALYVLKHYTGKTASKVAQRNQKKILVSFILYCIPLSTLNLASAVSCILTLTSRRSNGVNKVLLVSKMIDGWMIQYRTLIISLSTLFALPSYRRAMLRALHLKKTTIKIATIDMKSTAYPVIPNNIASGKHIQ
uniref:G-protein coupled receptors family 1 profile domain-containing protein n=1 Tax=Parascaris univalens TaxID=6257 RepID=A0A915AFC3_PARUN